MIKFLNDETVAGFRYGKGTIAQFDQATETQLIASADAVLSPLPSLVAQSNVGWTRTSQNTTGGATPDNGWVILQSVIVPAGTMGLDSNLVIELDWSFTNSVNNKDLAVDWGGGNIVGPTFTTSDTSKDRYVIQNAHSLSSQTIQNSNNYGAAGTRTTSAVNTANAATLDFKCKWRVAVVETITLIGYSVWHYPGS